MRREVRAGPSGRAALLPKDHASVPPSVTAALPFDDAAYVKRSAAGSSGGATWRTDEPSKRNTRRDPGRCARGIRRARDVGARAEDATTRAALVTAPGSELWMDGTSTVHDWECRRRP